MENQSNHKTMPSTVLDHSPSTTSRVRQSILRKTLRMFMGYPRRYNNSPPHKSLDFSVRLGLQTSHQRYDIMHLLVSKTPCRAYVSLYLSKNGHLAQIKFSRKMCQIGKTCFQNYVYKNLDLFIKYLK